jgi:adhesin transport system outer membrane protein
LPPFATAAALVLALTLALGAGSISAQPLDAELRGLLTSHPELLAREKAVESADQGVRRAYAGYLPRLDAVGEFGPQYIDSPVTSQAGGGSWLKDKEVIGGSLTQRLFDGFATPSTVRSARLNREVASFTLSGTQQNVLFDGIEAYVEVLRQHELVRLARGNEATIMRQLNLEDERVKRGAGIAVDVLQAKSRLQLAKERRVAFEGALADASARYLQVFGHAPDPATMTMPEPPTAPLPFDAADAVTIAVEENPAIDSSLATIEVASEQRRRARADYYPTLDVVAEANRERNNDLVEGTREDAALVLRATWNLFNGLATTASVRQAAIDYHASQDNHESVRRRVGEMTRLAWNEYETANTRYELLDNGVAIAAEVFEARQKLREAGKETLINVLDADNELYTARINYVIADGDRRLAIYRLLQGMGRLDPPRLNL